MIFNKGKELLLTGFDKWKYPHSKLIKCALISSKLSPFLMENSSHLPLLGICINGSATPPPQYHSGCVLVNVFTPDKRSLKEKEDTKSAVENVLKF